MAFSAQETRTREGNNHRAFEKAAQLLKPQPTVCLFNSGWTRYLGWVHIKVESLERTHAHVKYVVDGLATIS